MYDSYTVYGCEYTSFEEAAATDPMMAHVSKLRPIQPEELPDVRNQLGDEYLEIPVEYEHRYTDTADKPRGNRGASVRFRASSMSSFELLRTCCRFQKLSA